MLRNTQGRFVGIGISYDRYDEESNAGRTSPSRRFGGEVRMPNWKKEEIASLSGPCITIVPARKEAVACTSTQI